MPLTVSAAPKQLSDANTQGTVVCPALDSSGAAAKLAFYGASPVAQATGFGTPTGASRLINYPGATATLAQTSGAMADLLTLLKTAGLIGN